MSTDELRGKVRSIEKENRRRSVAMMACGAVIVPSWLAVAWYLPDFRLLATVGLATALWILYHAHRRTSALRLAVDMTSSPSLAFYRELLERELDWHRRLPVWFLPPAALSTGGNRAHVLLECKIRAHTGVLRDDGVDCRGRRRGTGHWVEAKPARSRPLAA